MADLNSPKRPYKTYIAAGFGFIILLGILGSNLTQTAVQGVSTSASPSPTVATVESTTTLSNTTVTPQSSLKTTTTVAPTVQPSTVKPTVFVPTATPTTVPASTQSNDQYYTNVDGNRVQSPSYSESQPSNASAQCRDGSYSYSQHRQGTCSGHGGVAEWL